MTDRVKNLVFHVGDKNPRPRRFRLRWPLAANRDTLKA